MILSRNINGWMTFTSYYFELKIKKIGYWIKENKKVNEGWKKE
jgi:hypothetical protein